MTVETPLLDESFLGYSVLDNDDDDPVLVRADGSIVDTWRENYPYTEKLDRATYELQKRALQIELLKLQSGPRRTAAAS